MSLSAEDRANLFRTDNLQCQIQKLLLQKPGYRISEKELRDFFWDISNGAFHSAVIALRTKGIIRKVEDDILLEKGKVRMLGEISDKVWRAIRIEKIFTIESLSYLTGLESYRVRSVVDKLIKKHHVEFIGWERRGNTRIKIYEVSTDSLCRPTRDREYLSAIDSVWRALYKLRGNFVFVSDVIDIMDTSISTRHARRLIKDICSWKCIEKKDRVGRNNVYFIPSNLPPKKYGMKLKGDLK